MDLDRYIINYNIFYNNTNLFYLATITIIILKLANLVERALGLVVILKRPY